MLNVSLPLFKDVEYGYLATKWSLFMSQLWSMNVPYAALTKIG